jgi:hypothetical protein
VNLFYVMGGGMGHLFRIAVFIKQFDVQDYTILSSNPLAFTLFPESKIIFIAPANYKSAWESFVNEKLSKLHIKKLYIDCFPDGLTGEFYCWPEIDYPVYYLARRLKWSNYQSNVKPAMFDFEIVYQLEELEDEHLTFINAKAKKIEQLTLNYLQPKKIDLAAFNIPSAKVLWLIVHAFDTDEVEMLLQYAETVAHQEKCSPYFVIISDQEIDVSNGVCIRYFPAVDWFPLAERIFCGAGFNTVQQVKPYLGKTTLIPFPRKYDDQVWRAGMLYNSTRESEAGCP